MKAEKNNIQTTIIASAAAFAVGALAVYAFKQIPPKHRAQTRLRSGKNDLTSALPIPSELCQPRGTPGVFFGDHPVNAEMQICKPADIDGHVAVIGQSGSGKTSSVIVPTIETFPGPMFLIDTKGGDMAKKWKQVHGNSDRILKIIRPSATEESPCWIDPFELMNREPCNKSGIALDIAEAILPSESTDLDPVWRESAQSILAGALIYYFDMGVPFSNALIKINSMPASELVEEIAAGNNVEAAAYVKELVGVEPKTLLSLGLELRDIGRMISVPGILNALTKEDTKEAVSLYDFALGSAPFDLLLEIPDADLSQYRPLITLIVTQLIKYLGKRPEKVYDRRDSLPILLLLDELPRLGYMPALVDALNTLRSKNVTCLLCVQSIASLQAIYGESDARVILENLPYKVILGACEVESQDFLSKIVGNAFIESISSTMSLPFSMSQSFHLDRRPYIYPEAFQSMKHLIVVSPYGACVARKHCFWAKNKASFTFI